MKHLKNISHILSRAGLLAGAVLAVWLTGCNRSPLDGGQGTLSFIFEQNSDLTTKSGDIGYTLDIVDAEGDTVAHYADHRNVPTIKLKEGVYTIHAKDNTPTPETSKFGQPRYGGIQEVNVIAGRNQPVIMNCKLLNIKVMVTEFEQDIKDNFTEYSLVVKPTEDYIGRDTLTFTQAEVDATPQQAGWINQTENGRFVLIFRVRNKQTPDKLQIYIRTIADAVPADFYQLKVRMAPTGDPSDGGTMFRLSVKTDLNEYEFPFDVKDHTRPAPVVTRHDGGDISQSMITQIDTRDGDLRVDIRADAGIQRLRIRHEDPDVLLRYGLPGMITLGGDNDAATDEAQRPAVSEVIEWSEGTVVGATDVWVDFSRLGNTAMLDGNLLPIGEYRVDIEAYDYDNQMVTWTVMFSVMPAMDLIVDRVRENAALACYVDLSGQWQTPTQPENLTFEYTVQGQDAWQRVSSERVKIEGKQVTTQLTGLIPETTYEYRLVGDGVRSSDLRTFTTDVRIDLPNLDFEAGYTIASISSGFLGGESKNVWSPNLDGDSFWATGNPGSTFEVFGAGLKKNVTTQAPSGESLYGQGHGLRMQTYDVNVLEVKSLASGTIYSGAFGYISSAPTSPEAQTALVKYGQPYTARPLGLKGWYKYTPQVITKDYGGKHADLVEEGAMDRCRVTIILENWGAATSRPAQPQVIGSGEFLGDLTGVNSETNDYFPFEFKIEYQNTTLKPTHIVMSAASSYRSDDFCGGPGSVFYIDDFELIWDPDQLSAN